MKLIARDGRDGWQARAGNFEFLFEGGGESKKQDSSNTITYIKLFLKKYNITLKDLKKTVKGYCPKNSSNDTKISIKV
jgi:hypothetical protein